MAPEVQDGDVLQAVPAKAAAPGELAIVMDREGVARADRDSDATVIGVVTDLYRRVP